jgi:hypothetical protein
VLIQVNILRDRGSSGARRRRRGVIEASEYRAEIGRKGCHTDAKSVRPGAGDLRWWRKTFGSIVQKPPEGNAAKAKAV